MFFSLHCLVGSASSDMDLLFSGMALLGCDVVATDQKEVLPLLRRNAERNTSRIMQMNPGSGVL